MNKRGQIQAILAFIVIVVALILFAPIILKVVTTPLTKFSQAVNPIDNVSATAVSTATAKFTGFFDTVIMIAFFANVLVLFVSSFFIDSHPALVVLYIIGLVVLFMFSPNYLQAIDKVYTSDSFTTETGNLQGTSGIYNNFGFILLGVVLISGVLMFAKFKFGSRPEAGY